MSQKVLVEIMRCPNKSSWYAGRIGELFFCYEEQGLLLVASDRDDPHSPIIRMIVKEDCLIRVAEQRNGAAETQHTCPRCEGTGKFQRLGFPAKDCALCNGSGQV